MSFQYKMNIFIKIFCFFEIAQMLSNPSTIERGGANLIYLYAISLIKKTIKIEKSIDFYKILMYNSTCVR